jgi:hypothetical protein
MYSSSYNNRESKYQNKNRKKLKKAKKRECGANNKLGYLFKSKYHK